MSPFLAQLEPLLPRATLDAFPLPVFVHRPDGTVVAINRVASLVMGLPETFPDPPPNLLRDPMGLAPELLEAFKRAAEGECASVRATFMDPSKIEILDLSASPSVWVESTMFPLRDAAGEIAFVVTLQRDVSEIMESRSAIERAAGEIAEQRELISRLEAAQRQIDEQRETIQALESPIIEVAEGVLMLPVIGAVTERRAIDMMDKILSAVSASRSRYMILDLTGSEHVDTTTANHFSSILRAVALLGAQGIVVGIRPHVAQTMTSLGLDLRGVLTYRNLREALNHCVREAQSSSPRAY